MQTTNNYHNIILSIINNSINILLIQLKKKDKE